MSEQKIKELLDVIEKEIETDYNKISCPARDETGYYEGSLDIILRIRADLDL